MTIDQALTVLVSFLGVIIGLLWRISHKLTDIKLFLRTESLRNDKYLKNWTGEE